MANIFAATKSIPLTTSTTNPEAPLTALRTEALSDETSATGPTRHKLKLSDTVVSPRDYGSDSSPEHLLQCLRSQPDTHSLLAILKQLSRPDTHDESHLASTGPLQSRVINVLVYEILPNYWQALARREKELLASCLRNLTGISAMHAQLRSPTLQRSVDSKAARTTDRSPWLECLSLVLSGDKIVSQLVVELSNAISVTTKCTLALKELASLLGSGKIISIAAQAEDEARSSNHDPNLSPHWLSRGSEYAGWLGRNIALVYNISNESLQEHVRNTFGAQLLSKALNLGYSTALLRALITCMIDSRSGNLSSLTLSLAIHTRRQLLEQILRWFCELAPSSDDDNPLRPDSGAEMNVISALGWFVQWFISTDLTLMQHIGDLLGDAAFASSLSVSVRRACVAALAASVPDELQGLLEQLMTTFTASLFISHAPVLQQDAVAQTLLLATGYLHRLNPTAVLMIARSSDHMQGTSKRLDASGVQARWLGMIVAMGMSSLIDRDGSKMNFGTDEVQTVEAEWYMSLVKIDDEIGTLDDFEALLSTQSRPRKRSAQILTLRHVPPTSYINGKLVYGPERPPMPVQTEVIGDKITELVDDTSDEDIDLKPYAKPDSDPEDSDEDATLVTRNKARAPVYIRDLMAMLQDDKDHDRFQLGIRNAARLIRRKAAFGREVKDHAEELLGILCNLQDLFSTNDFDELKLQAMIAVLLSDVEHVGPWLSRQAFVEGYSIAERCIMLSALGLGGRELAGFTNEDELNPVLSDTAFASKRLSPRLHEIFTSSGSHTKLLDHASKTIEAQLIQPMALRAADESTAHLSAIKVRTFSSRMEVERTKRKTSTNRLGKIVGQVFLYPLSNRYQQELATYGSRSVFASVRIVLTTFLKTLALLLHASGPATLDLPQITADFWDLLLSLRVRASSDMSVLEAVLFSILTILGVNTDKRRLSREESKRLVETQQWVEIVFERAGGSDVLGNGAKEEARIRSLAAGILIKMREVAEVYQKETFGRVLE
ncbi:hypothetical protein LTR62_001026 [Meristemomyces frigidus]|uniref:Telomere length regulation protein conserved domain-containing protein n=1 Tax=Meristemomyces frigidus TaxID=1508187 RepID=A0AAN7TC18_9PEZI|nr:hypothetical protein LTR62_001026 [Meristemomyces frigidus]